MGPNHNCYRALIPHDYDPSQAPTLSFNKQSLSRSHLYAALYFPLSPRCALIITRFETCSLQGLYLCLVAPLSSGFLYDLGGCEKVCQAHQHVRHPALESARNLIYLHFCQPVPGERLDEKAGHSHSNATHCIRLTGLPHPLRFPWKELGVGRPVHAAYRSASLCHSHLTLGDIYRCKGEPGKAIDCFEVALGIASSFGWQDGLFWTNHSLAGLFLDEGRFDDAQTHVNRVKLYAADSAYSLSRVMCLQAEVWCD